MKRRLIWVGGLGGLVCLGWLAWHLGAAPDTSPVVRHDKGVVFATPGGESLKLDLALPGEGAGPFPAVICLHHGGWVQGDRSMMSATIDALARRGYVGVAPDYRLAPKHRFPACVEDCKAAVRWLRGNAARYRLDPDRIGVVGLSAGGHLACMLGVTSASDGLEGSGDYQTKSSAVQAVVAMSAPNDLTAAAVQTPAALKRSLEPLLGGPPSTHGDAYRRASPAHYRPVNPPPFLFIHGSADGSVPVAQMRAFSDKLKTCGGSAREVVLVNEGHTWAGAALTRSIDQTLAFLDEKLKP